jgi:hypothetical protein
MRRQEAVTQATIAEERTLETEKVKDQAQRTESGLLANASSKLLDERGFGAAVAAVLLALEALPDKAAGIDRPYVPEAEFQLERAFSTLLERAVLAGHQDAVDSASFSPDGMRVVTAPATRRHGCGTRRSARRSPASRATEAGSTARRSAPMERTSSRRRGTRRRGCGTRRPARSSPTSRATDVDGDTPFALSAGHGPDDLGIDRSATPLRVSAHNRQSQ